MPGLRESSREGGDHGSPMDSLWAVAMLTLMTACSSADTGKRPEPGPETSSQVADTAGQDVPWALEDRDNPALPPAADRFRRTHLRWRCPPRKPRSRRTDVRTSRSRGLARGQRTHPVADGRGCDPGPLSAGEDVARDLHRRSQWRARLAGVWRTACRRRGFPANSNRPSSPVVAHNGPDGGLLFELPDHLDNRLPAKEWVIGLTDGWPAWPSREAPSREATRRR